MLRALQGPLDWRFTHDPASRGRADEMANNNQTRGHADRVRT
jgi:hypothetical protein